MHANVTVGKAWGLAVNYRLSLGRFSQIRGKCAKATVRAVSVTSSQGLCSSIRCFMPGTELGVAM